MNRQPPFSPQTRRRDAVLRLWPAPAAAAWCRVHRCWHPRWPRIAPYDIRSFEGVDGEAFEDVNGWEPALSSLLPSIPPQVLKTLEDAPRHLWFACLVLVHDLPESADLLVSDVVPASLLAAHVAGDAERTDELRDALAGPRRALLVLLGLPPRKWILSTLRRTEPRALNYGGAIDLLWLLQDARKKVRRVLQHSKTIGPSLVRLLSDDDLLDMASPSLLLADDVSALDWHLRQLRELRDRDEAPKTPRVIRARPMLDALLDHQDEEPPVHDPEGEAQWPIPFGDLSLVLDDDPPIHVRVVRTQAEMIKLGRSMANCLSDEPEMGYTASLMAGTGCLVLLSWVDSPEHDFVLAGLRRRAVAFLRLRGCWAVDEVEAPAGMDVPDWVSDRLDEHAWFTPVEEVDVGLLSTALQRQVATLQTHFGFWDEVPGA